MLIITSDGSTLDTDGDAVFEYAPVGANGDGYVELHIDVDFGLLGQALTINLPAPAIESLHLRLHGDQLPPRNLRIVEP